MSDWKNDPFYQGRFKTRGVRRPRGFGGIPWGGLAIALVVLLFIGGGIAWEVVKNTHTERVAFTVHDKAIKIDCDNNDNNGCKSVYLIYTDRGVYKDADSIWFWKWDSSDLYGKLQKGRTYSCKVTGFRIHFTSSYPNLISCEGV